jgi:hypothetical protein
MARAEIMAGNCGYTTVVEAQADGMRRVTLRIESECAAIQMLAEQIAEVDPFQEISFRGEGPQALALGHEHCTHTGCPVPVGIIKAVEVAAGLALPGDATIHITKE